MTVSKYLNEFLINKFLIVNKISNTRHIWLHLDTYVSILKFYFLTKFRELFGDEILNQDCLGNLRSKLMAV
jgi:hypothetical protein